MAGAHGARGGGRTSSVRRSGTCAAAAPERGAVSAGAGAGPATRAARGARAPAGRGAPVTGGPVAVDTSITESRAAEDSL